MKLKKNASILGVTLLLAALPFFFREQAMKARNPAMVFPVTLLCSGPADQDRVFNFGSANGDLSLKNEAGTTRVHGAARVAWRWSGDNSEFDGVVQIEGTRSGDGRIYELEGRGNGMELKFTLERNDAGLLIVTDPIRGGNPRQFHSFCQDDPSGY